MVDKEKIDYINDWAGNEDRLLIEKHCDILYDLNSFDYEEINEKEPESIDVFNYYADKDDYILSAAVGLITGMLDIFWIGEFSIKNALNWSNQEVNKFVVYVAKKIGFDGDDLKGAIIFLENNASIPSDKLTYDFGGGVKHHLRDFAHHPSILGLIFSILTQFTKKCYGVNKNGDFVCITIDDEYIGNDFYSKVIIATIKWFLHLVSDMAGSSNNPGMGMGIPGPIMSLASEIISILHLNELGFDVKDVYQKLERIFEGRLNDSRIKFDLRSEIGIVGKLSKQSIPVYLNRALIKSIYIIKHFIQHIKDNNIDTIDMVSIASYYEKIKWDTQCYVRMCTVSSGVFTAADLSDAFIKNQVICNKKAIGLLLRINFVGVISFVIAIKNDIAYNIKHAILQKERISLVSQSIEIHLVYNVDELYRLRFDNIYKRIIDLKMNSIKGLTILEDIERPIVSTKDKTTRIYNEIVQNDNTLEEIVCLIMSLLKNNKILFIPNNESNIISKNRPFYRNENGKKVIYYFTWTIIECDYSAYKNDLENYDLINVVALVDLGDDIETVINVLKNEDEKNDVKGRINRMTIRTFFYHFFGEGEYLKFRHEITILNNRIHYLIGYNTIEIPTKETLKNFRYKCINIIKEYDYKKAFFDIYNNQYNILINNYIKEKKYLYIISGYNFSDSYISSEWYFNEMVYINEIEQTAIISGYLKSIEQLLYQLSLFSIDKGYKIKGLNGKELVEYTMKSINDKKVDLTFGSLIKFFEHNDSIWSVNNHIKRYIIGKLNIYRKKYRNDHFHKDNIFAFEEIKEIRNATLELYCLLLGGTKVVFDSVKEIENEQSQDCKYNFYDWIDKLIGGNNLINNYVPLLFFLSKSNIQILEYNGYNNEDSIDINKTECKQYINNLYKFDSSSYDFIKSSIYNWIKEYLVKGKYNNLLNLHENVLLFCEGKGLVRIK